jgi:HK97 family phage prohead protease/HK97 family phage major capsid protein
MKISRAWSTISIKSVDEDKRRIEGIASTPAPDRYNDVVEPRGIEFKLPLPLLYQHRASEPIGTVEKARVTDEGMAITAQIAPAGIHADIDKAWAYIKNGLVRGLSIGFRSLEESYDRETGGFHFIRTELMEISAVTIPANAEATITAVKSFDVDGAAIGQDRKDVVRLDNSKSNQPGAPGNLLNSGRTPQMKTIQEQIAAFEAKRQASMARMTAIMDKSADEGRTLDPAETEEYDGLSAEVKGIDEHLVRLREHEKRSISVATAITKETAGTQAAGSAARGGVVTVLGPSLPPGTLFTRYAIALARAKGNLVLAHEVAKSWKDTPQVERVLKAAVAAGTTTGDGWASELADYTYMASEFIEYLRPMTLIGKIAGLRRVPFNVKLPLQDSGSSVGWVGEGARKPVSKLHFDTSALRFAKAAGIVVLTDELVRFSNPSAEALVRADLAAAIVQFLDEQFINPSVAANGDISPASVTYGAGHDAASGTDADAFRADFKAAMTQILEANIDPTGLVVALQPTQAVALSLMRNALGQKEFPDISAEGGRIEGYQAVTSQSVPSGVMTYLQPREVFLADDGAINLDASREASLVMDDGDSPDETTMVSLWQNNLIALRVERTINWKRRRDAAVYYLTACAYGTAEATV